MQDQGSKIITRRLDSSDRVTLLPSLLELLTGLITKEMRSSFLLVSRIAVTVLTSSIKLQEYVRYKVYIILNFCLAIDFEI